jgi:hypothetical protein
MQLDALRAPVEAPLRLGHRVAVVRRQRRADGQPILFQRGEHGEIAACGAQVDVENPSQAERAAVRPEPPVAVHHPLGNHFQILDRAQPELFREAKEFARGFADSVVRHRIPLP